MFPPHISPLVVLPVICPLHRNTKLISSFLLKSIHKQLITSQDSNTRLEYILFRQSSSFLKAFFALWNKQLFVEQISGYCPFWPNPGWLCLLEKCSFTVSPVQRPHGDFSFVLCFFVVPKFKVQFYSAFVIDLFSSQSRRKMSPLVHKWNFAPVLLSFYSIIILTVVHGQILCWPSGQNLFSLTWGCIRDVNLSPAYIKMNH